MTDAARDEQIRHLEGAVTYLYSWVTETYARVEAVRHVLREKGVVSETEFHDRFAGMMEIGRAGAQGDPLPPEWLRALLQPRGSTEQ